MRRMYEVMVGLEVHVALSTRSKLFSGSSTLPTHVPNSHVSPFDAAHPGTLPRTNQGAVELGVRAALALHSNIPRLSSFQRKHYFYADLPHGYQVTQLDAPLALGGFLVYRPPPGPARKKPSSSSGGGEGSKGGGAPLPSPPLRVVRISRVQLEMDSGKSLHDAHPHASLVDLNRAGTPLIEVVMEPDIRSAEDAAAAVHALQTTLTFAGVTEGAMESGQLRVDVNVSIRPAPTTPEGGWDGGGGGGGGGGVVGVTHDALKGAYQYGVLGELEGCAGGVGVVAGGGGKGRGWAWQFLHPHLAASALGWGKGAGRSAASADAGAAPAPPAGPALHSLSHALSPHTLGFGARVEVKNLNSIRSVAQCVEAEAARQAGIVEGGGVVVGETRMFDATAPHKSHLLRVKEGSGDYRFLREPDLEPLLIPASTFTSLLATQPPTLFDMHWRLCKVYGLREGDAGVLCEDPVLYHAFEAAYARASADAAAGSGASFSPAAASLLPRATFNWLTTELGGRVKAGEGLHTTLKSHPTLPTLLGNLVALVEGGKISGKAGKDVLGLVLERVREGKVGSPQPKDIVLEMGWERVTDLEAIREMAIKVVNDPSMAAAKEKWRAGSDRVLGSFVSLLLESNGGKPCPTLASAALKELLGPCVKSDETPHVGRKEKARRAALAAAGEGVEGGVTH